MMSVYTESIRILVERLSKLPGIGRRSAERIITYILDAPDQEIRDLSGAITRVKENVRFCRVCNNLSEEELCRICRDTSRNKEVLCVVERPADISSIEKAGIFKGIYHVLHGTIAPLEGRGPQELKIDGLLLRLRDEHIREVIIATGSDTEGETTALYLTKVIKPLNVMLSRIGLGLPVGSALEYADAATISVALEARRNIS
ncbi:MAG: recombination mediator RecR [Candidatus Omnitrophica bacterium]|nr:recombination mediator RecR [Candidatus Omnitrophota bacterium]